VLPIAFIIFIQANGRAVADFNSNLVEAVSQLDQLF